MTVKKYSDFWTGLILLAGGAFMYRESYAIKQDGLISLGPAFFPRILLGTVMVLSIVLILRSVSFTRQQTAAKEKTVAGPADPAKREGRILQTIFLACLFAYILLLPVLSYLAATFLFCFATMTILGNITKKDLIINAVAAAITSYGLVFIFSELLHLFLP